MKSIPNPVNGSMLFSKPDLLAMFREDPKSPISLYEKGLKEQFVHLQNDAEHNKLMENLITQLEYCQCVYCRLDGNDISVIEGYIMAADSNKSIWAATIALKLSVQTGSQPMFMLIQADVSTLVFDGKRTKSLVLGDVANLDRLMKVLSRGSDGRPWVQLVR